MIFFNAQAWLVSPALQDSFVLTISGSCENLPLHQAQTPELRNQAVEASLSARVLQPLAASVPLDDPAGRANAIRDYLSSREGCLRPFSELRLLDCEAFPVHLLPYAEHPGWQVAYVAVESTSIASSMDITASIPVLSAPSAGNDRQYAAPRKPGIFRRLREKLQDLRQPRWNLYDLTSIRNETQDIPKPPAASIGRVSQITQPMDLSELHAEQESSDASIEMTREQLRHIEQQLKREQERLRVRALLTERKHGLGEVSTAPQEPVSIDETYAEQLRPQPCARPADEPLIGELPDDEELRSYFASEDDAEDIPRVQAAPPPSQITLPPEWIDTVPSDLTDILPASLCTTEVQFAAAAPRAVQPGEAFLLEVLMYEEHFRDRVQEMIRQSIGEVTINESGYYEMQHDQQVQVMLEIPDIGFRETSRACRWTGKLAKFSFMPAIPAHFSKPQLCLAATVIVDGLSLLDLKMILRLSKQPQEIHVERGKPRSIFICYAQRDTFEVHKRLQGILAIAPDLDIFIDWKRLRTGDAWRRRIKQEILNRDQLYLFWSRHARKSSAVNEEWRYALQHKGLRAITPMPLELPAACPPPDELNDAHFCDWALAYGYAHQFAYRKRRFWHR